MNRQFKVLLLILATVCVFSLCVISAGANEVEVQDPGMRPGNLLLITNVNCKTEYREGEYFDPTGFRGYVSCYDPKYSFYIESSDLTYLETAPLTPDITEITFVYGDLTAKYAINVTPLEVVGFEATASKTEFLALDTVDSSIFTLELLCADGSRMPVDASACSFSPSLDDPISAYVKAFTVTYSVGERTFSDIVEISVSPVLVVTFSGIETAYLYEGMTPEAPHGLVPTVHYDAAQTISRTVTDYEVEYDGETVKADANGKTIITLVFDSKKVNVEVAVSPIVNYKVTGFENVYYYGDSFSYANAQVTAVYADGNTRDVTSEVQFNAPTVITANSKVTAMHNGYDLAYFLNFSLPQGKLTVVTPPAKLQYEIGESFDATGLTVAIEYTDGTRRILTPEDYTINAPTHLSSTDETVTLNYHGATAEISIKVGHEVYITSLSLIGMPDVMSYYEGYLLDTSGIIIEAYYSDGTKARIDARTLNFTPSLTTPLTVDVTSVTISTGEGDKYCKVSYPITVKEKKAIALVAVSNPNKLVYAEGEKFDPAGLELRLYFNDDTYIVPSTYNFSPELGSAIILHSNATEKYIIHTTYEYEGVEFSHLIEITVKPAEIENLFITRTPVKTVYEIGEQFDPTGLDIIIVYKDRSLAMASIPDGYYTYSPSVITDKTTEIVFYFRGFSVSYPITVNGVESSDVVTEPIDPPTTTEPNTPPETTVPPEVTAEPTTEPPETTVPPETEVTTDAEVTTEEPDVTSVPEISTSPEESTTEGEESTENVGGEEKDPIPLLYIWIAVIGIIVIALVALIIYYKKNFT